MIVRIVVVDPRPGSSNPKSDILVYQVPEKSREFELLSELFEQAHIEWVVIEPNRKGRS